MIPRFRSFFLSVSLLIALTALLGGCDRDNSVTPHPDPAPVAVPVNPSVYLLGAPSDLTSQAVVFNFAAEVAPPADVGREPAAAGSVIPAIYGRWQWQDASRLVFLPDAEEKFVPGLALNFDLTALALRPGYSLAHHQLRFTLPPLTVRVERCEWQDIREAPFRRILRATLSSSYPVFNMRNSNIARIRLGGTIDVPFLARSGSHRREIQLLSDPLIRQAADTSLGLELLPGTVRLYGGTGPLERADASGSCTLSVNRAEWDALEEEIKPQITGITASWVERSGATAVVGGPHNNWGTLNVPAPRRPGADESGDEWLKPRIVVNLHRSGSGTKVRGPVGAVVAQGVSLEPAISGVWKYGDGIDLEFLPEEVIPPGTRFNVTVEGAAFPGLKFPHAVTDSLSRADMTGWFQNTALYTDPGNTRTKRITSQLLFTYPVKRGTLESRTAISMRIEPQKGFYNARRLAFEVSYDKDDPRLVYLTSAPITLPDEPGEVLLRVDAGVESAIGGRPTDRYAETLLAIPSTKEFFRVTGMSAQTVARDDGAVERLLAVTTATPPKGSEHLAQHLALYLLPDCRESNENRLPLCKERGISEWSSQEEIDDRVLEAAERIIPAWVSDNPPERTTNLFNFSAPEKRAVFAVVSPGVEDADGFALAREARQLIHTGQLDRELRIMHDGAILSITGSKKLGVASRGLQKVAVFLKRVVPHNMHHFVAFTRGEFAKPDFQIDIDHFAETFSYLETLPALEPGKDLERQYFSVDFGKFLNSAATPRGLFLLELRDASTFTIPAGSSDGKPDLSSLEASCNPRYRSDCPLSDRRLVLLTDLGILVKRSTAGEQNIYVMSFRTGLPVEGAALQLLGKNGVAVAQGTTDINGHLRLPSVLTLKDEKLPTVYTVRKGEDFSFLPYYRSDRVLNLSRFDTGGVFNSQEYESLQAYLFTDRGIYRPGDTVNLGLLIRRRDWTPIPEGLPLELVITDPREVEVLKRKVSFGKDGFTDVAWHTLEGGATGTFRAAIYITRGDSKERLAALGYTSLRVEEFQPDRLAVKSELIGAAGLRWMTPRDARAAVTVRNLFGSAAAGNTVAGELSLRPWGGYLPDYPGYLFRGTSTEALPDTPQDLGEVKTDENGRAEFALQLDRFSEPVYEIQFVGEGFEKGAGRSVVSTAQTLVSSQPFLLGYKPDGDYGFITKGAARGATLIAVGSSGQPVVAEGLKAELVRKQYVSTLIRQPNGLFAYQSVQKKEPVSSTPLTVAETGSVLPLHTDAPGEYEINLVTADGATLLSMSYTVAGDANVTRNVERNAELTVTLDRKEYSPGQEITAQIVAPYSGSGLITIEQDGVLTQRWFRSTTNASVQRITLPREVRGNAYLSVAYVRALDSKEIFMSPLSYATQPFQISKAAYKSKVGLTVPDHVVPGTSLEVSYSVSEASRVVVYAVDEGILQFARYQNPQPLDHFFRKRALQVSTYQILDLLLPDYQLVQSLSRPGGDEDSGAGKYKNPFARKHKPPMVFWSGIREVLPGNHTVEIPIPTYFNGALRVLAVAASPERIGTAVANVIAKGPFVLQPQQPYVVAPGDEFEVGLLVANNTPHEKVSVKLDAPAVLRVLSENPVDLTLGEGRDAAVRFRVRAGDTLGPAAITYTVSGGAATMSEREELSIRPAQPFRTSVQQGVLRIDAQRAGEAASVAPQRTLFEDFREVEFTASVTPFGILKGIIEYLKQYPYGCTEQITSQAFPALVLGTDPELGLTQKDTDRLLQRALRTLRARQKHTGDFGLWSLESAANPFYSVYAVHFLLEARDAGIDVPADMLEKALRFLDTYSADLKYQWEDHRAQAYALYLLARSGKVVTERVRRLESELVRQWISGSQYAPWTRFFLGASYKILQLDADADRFFGEFERNVRSTKVLPWEIQRDPAVLGLYLYLLHKHFPVEAHSDGFKAYLLELAQEIAKTRVQSFSGSMAVLGMATLSGIFSDGTAGAFEVQRFNGGGALPLPLEGSTVKRAPLASDTTKVSLKGDGLLNLYYQVREAGYDRNLSAAEVADGLKISRRLLNQDGKEVSAVGLSDRLIMELHLHPANALEDLAVVALLPGGFEIDLSDEGLGSRQSLPVSGNVWAPEYIDVQEDRVVFFGDLDREERVFSFALKPLNKGIYQVPPAFAEGMYDTAIQYRGTTGSIEVHD